jgi:hypothetical protein
MPSVKIPPGMEAGKVSIVSPVPSEILIVSARPKPRELASNTSIDIDFFMLVPLSIAQARHACAGFLRTNFGKFYHRINRAVETKYCTREFSAPRDVSMNVVGLQANADGRLGEDDSWDNNPSIKRRADLRYPP